MKQRYNEEELLKLAIEQGAISTHDNIIFAVSNGTFFNTNIDAENYVYGKNSERDLIVYEIKI